MDWGVWLIVGASVVLAPTAFKYGVVPWRFGRSFWMDPAAKPEYIDPDDPRVPNEAAEHIARAVVELEALGFAFLAVLRLGDAVPNIESYAATFTNERDRCAALAATVLIDRNGVPTITEQCLEFISETRDGIEIDTINAATVPTHEVAVRRVVFAPRVRDADALYRVHQAALRGLCGASLVPQPPEHVFARLESLARVEGDRYLQSGRWRRAENGRLRPRLIHAYAICWGQSGLWGRFRRWRYARAAAPFVREADR